jgi:hypothetical protein
MTRPYIGHISGTGTIDSVYGNVYADPMFVDRDNGDLRLQKGSPCIDVGVPWILDVDGTRSDIGAFGGPGGSFYIYQDLPPQQPKKFEARRDDQRVTLQWQKNTESDLRFYILFRAENSGVPLDSAHMRAYLTLDGGVIGAKQPNIKHLLPVGSADTLPSKQLYEGDILLYSSRVPDQATFTDDSVSEQSDYYYVLVAVDSSGLVSPPAEITVPAVDSGVRNPFLTPNSGCQEGISDSAPDSAFLEPNYPNPFNATTAIVYSLPNLGAQPAPVRLTVYNILGQEIRSLVNEKQQPGRHVAYWDATNEAGLSVASGVYLYRLEVSGIEFVKSGKMIVIK